MNEDTSTIIFSDNKGKLVASVPLEGLDLTTDQAIELRRLLNVALWEMSERGVMNEKIIAVFD